MQIPGVGSITIPAYTWNSSQTMTFPGGTQRSYTYDALMRLQSLTATDPGGTPLLNYQYTYDSVGNILTKQTEHGLYGYGYDAVSRLTSADNPVLADESYTYDAVGNRLTSADVSGSWTYNLNNELLGYADVEYDYDDNGNLTEIRVAGSVVWTYTYDAANRLVHVEDGTGSISVDYYYDPFGRRLWKDVGGTKTYFFYSEEGLIAEYDATGTEIRSYGYKPDSTWTTDPLWQKVGSTYYWYQNDHLGTPQKLTAMDGTVVWSAQYNAFGEANIDVQTVENNLRFPGQYEDDETGLHYNFQRYYNPKSGRYIQADPVGFGGGDVNWYEYARNTPTAVIDPLGLSTCAGAIYIDVNADCRTDPALTGDPNEIVCCLGEFCTGTLIDPQVVLTAAHCNFCIGREDQTECHDIHFNIRDPFRSWEKVIGSGTIFIPHPPDDIALLILDEEVRGQSIYPLDRQKPKPGEPGINFGFGRDEPYVDEGIFTGVEEFPYMYFRTNNDVFKRGDSGGPTFIMRDDQCMITAINAINDPLTSEDEVVPVYRYVEWIDTIVLQYTGHHLGEY